MPILETPYSGNALIILLVTALHASTKPDSLAYQIWWEADPQW